MTDKRFLITYLSERKKKSRREEEEKKQRIVKKNGDSRSIYVCVGWIEERGGKDILLCVYLYMCVVYAYV
jgi:hypothetical protein